MLDADLLADLLVLVGRDLAVVVYVRLVEVSKSRGLRFGKRDPAILVGIGHLEQMHAHTAHLHAAHVPHVHFHLHAGMTVHRWGHRGVWATVGAAHDHHSLLAH